MAVTRIAPTPTAWRGNGGAFSSPGARMTRAKCHERLSVDWQGHALERQDLGETIEVSILV
jgi:hypothetical protein